MLSQVRHQFDDHFTTGLIDQLPALAAAIEQTRLLQGFQMKRQRRQGQAKMLADLTRRLWAVLRQMAEDTQSRVLGEGAEYGDSD